MNTNNVIIPYNSKRTMLNRRNNLNDLSGTFDDIGQLIAYVRDLTRSLVPLSDEIYRTLSNPSDVVSQFAKNNPALVVAGVGGGLLVGGYLVTGMIKNIKQIQSGKY